MTPFDDLLDRATRRLGADPELQLEVRRELRAHLSDSAAEHAAAGDADPAAAAAGALGDPDALADQLYAANRRRLRVRRAVRWTVGLTAVPALVALAVAVSWGGIVAACGVNLLTAHDPTPGSTTARVRDGAWAARRAGLTPAQRLVFDAGSPDGTPADRALRAKALVDAAPTNRVYFANYALRVLEVANTVHAVTSPDGREDVGPLVAVLNAGERIDPDNAFYPSVRSGVLFTNAVRNRDGPDYFPGGFDYTRAGRQADRFDVGRIRVLDPTGYARALADLHAAAGRGFLTGYVLEFARQRMALLPPPTSLADAVLTLPDQAMAADLGWQMSMGAIWWAGPAAVDAAAAGRLADGTGYLDDAARLKRLAAADPTANVWARVGDRVDQRLTGYRSVALAVAGRTADAARAADQFRVAEAARAAAADRWSAEAWMRPKLTAGVLPSQMRPSPELPGMAAGLAPERAAEYSVADQVAVSVIVLSVAVVVVVTLAWAMAARLTSGRWPAALFVGSRPLLITAAVTALPAAAYLAFARVPGVGGRQWGLWTATDRICVEYAAVAALTALAWNLSTAAAVRRRAAQLSVDAVQPRPVGRWYAAVGAALAIAAIVFRAQWRPVEDGQVTWGYALAAATAAYAVGWVRPRGRRPAPSSRARVLLIAAAVALGSVGLGTVVRLIDPRRALPPSMTSLTLLCAVGTAALAIAIWRATVDGRRQAGPRFSYALSAVPSLLASAVVLAVVVGGAARLAERHGVRAMRASGADPLDLLRPVVAAVPPG